MACIHHSAGKTGYDGSDDYNHHKHEHYTDNRRDRFGFVIESALIF
jgi:hypothetical protein